MSLGLSNQNIIPIGISETSNSQPIGSLGSFLKRIGSYINDYDFFAGFFSEIPGAPQFLDLAFKGFGSYINAIEDHKFDFALPFKTVVNEPITPEVLNNLNPLGSRGGSNIRGNFSLFNPGQPGSSFTRSGPGPVISPDTGNASRGVTLAQR